ncbi:hypothetical protein CRM22_007134 [Opisthorchis felineus]|uniref:Lipocalin/cytosolic fatty-acid binding domain-containing protein n=1 Tax=Opisthorchis felineus TaxID=147828 RepID=A0A4S2LQ32_OPIFE|nr:hypothetical protein CRM22_007134 [Opisthorchis felineus]
MSGFVGKWKVAEQENLDLMFGCLSMSEEKKREILETAFIEYKLIGTQKIRISSNMYLSPDDVELTFGEEFEKQGVDGTVVKAVVEKISDAKIIYTQKHPVLKVVIESELRDGFIIMTIRCLGMKAIVKLQKLE